jgi:hypothetical protein
MPITTDIADHDLYGPWVALGREQGMRAVLLRLMDERFGLVSEGVREQMETLSARQLERITLRQLQAPSLEDLLS